MPAVIDIDLEACRFPAGIAEVYVGVNRNHIGRVAQVIGPVLDLQFEVGQLPEIYHAVRITSQGFDTPEPYSFWSSFTTSPRSTGVSRFSRALVNALARAMTCGLKCPKQLSLFQAIRRSLAPL